MTELHRRWKVFLEQFDPASQKFLRDYRKQLGPYHALKERNSPDLPYWIFFPEWLEERYSPVRHSRSGGGFLDDIMWGQYCLFLFIRMQDDLFDGHLQHRDIIYLADQFLLECERQFHKHFSGNRGFWNSYRDLLQETTLAILEISKLQESFHSSADELLERYKRVNAVFKVGMVAFCSQHHKMNHIKYFGQFYDHMSMGSQILDDFKDIGEDVGATRFNYVVKRIVERRNDHAEIDVRNILPHIATALCFTTTGKELLFEAKQHFAEAFAAIQQFQFPDTDRFRKYYLHSVDSIIERFQQKQFASIVLTARRNRRSQFRAS